MVFLSDERSRLDAADLEGAEALRRIDQASEHAARFPADEREREAVRRARADRLASVAPSPGRRAAAYHEAGHVVVLWAEGGRPRGAAICGEGGTAYAMRGEGWPVTALVAGGEAERLAGYPDGTPSEGDLAIAHRQLEALPVVDRKAYLAGAARTANRLLRERWLAVERLAGALIASGALDGSEIAEILTGAGARRA